MKKSIQLTIMSGFLLMLILPPAFADTGGGDLRLGYMYLDEEGNRSVNQASFNYYDGIGVSLEGFRYNFNNGIRVSSNLRNINLENRNLSLGISRPGLFGADVKSSQYRRIYDFEGDNFTKRNLTSANVWLMAGEYIKFYGRGSFNDYSGRKTDLFGTDFVTIVDDVDYQRNKFTVGTILKYRGRMFQAEYGKAEFEDQVNAGKDQERQNILLRALTTVPNHEWLSVSGVFDRFETEYEDTGFKIKSTGVKGSLLAELSRNFSLNYSVVFNRAASDSDFVETDNLAHAVYLTYARLGMYGLTAGYQNDVNDDYEDAIEGNSFYLTGWYMPNENFEFKSEYGSRIEEVDDGARLVGDQKLDRFKFYGKYRAADKGTFKAGVTSKNRKNDQLDSEIEYTSVYFESYLSAIEYAAVSAGYSYSTGNYENLESDFEFTSIQAHCDIQFREYKNFAGQFGVIYYRSQRDLDVESFDIHFKLSYSFINDSRIEAGYKVYNFDDFNFLNQYYTENIVEINIIKAFKF